jgi:hypothetical protein
MQLWISAKKSFQGEVVDLCKEYFSGCSCGSLQRSLFRVKLWISAKKTLRGAVEDLCKEDSLCLRRI